MFSTLHIVALCVSALFIVLGTVFSRKVGFDKIIKIMLGIGIVSELIKVFTYILMNEDKLGGYLPKTDLPFHLCSIQILLLVTLRLSKNENAKRIIRSFMLPTCLIGGLAAILIPTSSSVGTLNILTFQYFGYHAAIVVFALRMLIGRDIRFEIKDYGTCLLLLFVTMFGAIYINSILYNGIGDGSIFYEVSDGTHTGVVQLTNVNFMYVVNPPQSGLPFLNEDHGWGVYLAHYMCLCLFVVTLIYVKPIVSYFKSRAKKDAPEVETDPETAVG